MAKAVLRQRWPVGCGSAMIGVFTQPPRTALGVAMATLVGLLGLAGTAQAAPRISELRFAAAPHDRFEASLVLRRRGDAIELLTNAGMVLVERPLDRTSEVAIDGADGHIDNTLTVDLAGGPIGVPHGIHYDGGHGGYNTLALVGGSSSGEESTPSGPHSGVIEVDRTRVKYADIAPITDTSPASTYTFEPPAAGGPVLIADGPPVGGEQTITISGEGFESTTIAQKGAITIAGTGGTDSFTTDVTLAPTGLTGPVTIDGSKDTSNTAVFEATPAGVQVEYVGAADDSVTVGGGGGVQAIAGSLSIAFATGAGSVTLDDGADTTGRTVEVGPAQISGLSPNAIVYTQTSRLSVEGGSGSDTFEVTPSAATTYAISGAGPAPPAFPGNQLLLESDGATAPALVGTWGAAGAQGAWLFGNRLPVSFDGIDSLTPTAASIGDATVNPGQVGTAPATFPAELLAPTTGALALPFATADASATAAAGDYQPASGTIDFAPGARTGSLNVNVPGTTTPGPSRSFLVNLSPTAGAEVLRGQATGTILDTNPLSVTPAIAPVAPTITSTKQSASIWREGTRLPRIAASRPPVGSTFSFVLNEQADVTLTFTGTSPGRKVGGRCVAASGANRGRAHCTRTLSAGTLTFAGRQGTNSLYFDGRLSATKKLPLGRYTLSILASNAQGQRSTPESLSFTIVK
jgi:hypothetical protein